MVAVFTIVSANYIAFAATLMQSVRRFHPDIPRFIILSDARHSFEDIDLAAELIACDELGIDLIGNMKLWYSVIEFNTAVKPFTFDYLFTERGFEAAIYLDPDIQLYSPLHEVFAGLQDHTLVLTPHMTRPLQDGKHPSDLSIMKSGVYNLGFAAIVNDEDGRGLIRWWCDRLFAHCRVDIPGNIFTDQRWMDLSPAFVARTKLLRHPGYNVAYWNLVHRRVEQDIDGQWRVDGEKLAFFHFSGISPTDPSYFSKHQDRFTIETLGSVAELCNDYRARVLANGWLTYNKIPYAYATFRNGRKILDAMRHWVLEAIDDGRLPSRRPLMLNGAFFDGADERTFAEGGKLTRFAHQFWRDRPDLQDAFNLNRQDGFDGYVAWFCDGSAGKEGVPDALIQAARRLRDGVAASPVPDQPTAPPWPALATDAWAGPARDAAQWLQGEVHFSLSGVSTRLQRQTALLWERRIDLQKFFPIADRQGLEDYHRWSITDGMREGSIVADLFSANYIAWLDEPSSIARLYPGVPITHGMALTRHSEHARTGLQSWRSFPLDAKARVEQAFWFAFLAPGVFNWSPAITASVRAYFDAPSGLTVGPYPLSRGVLAIHAMRADLEATFDLADEDGRWRYLCWVLLQGTREYGVAIETLCPDIAGFLAAPSPAHVVLSRLAVLAYEHREDLRDRFHLRARLGLAGMQTWAREEMGPWLEGLGLSGLLHAPRAVERPEPLGPHRCYAALTGDWSVSSGIGEDLRTAAAALDACGFGDYVIVDLPTQAILRADRVPLAPGQAVHTAWNVIFHNADTAIADWLALRKLGVKADRVAGHWLWELERMPGRWMHSFSFCDEIWASSRFVSDIFEVEGRRPVRLLHHAVVAPRPAVAVSRQELGLNADTTVFLFMFDFASYAARKNPGAVVQAFCAAFPRGDERACLVIKTQNADLRPDLWMALAGMSDDPRVVLRDARLSRDELIGLITTADAFVSLHRSEGFGRGPAEAMLLGVPVILTGYSGTTDFTDPDCACVVGYELIDVQPNDYPGVEGQRWAEADVVEAARAVRWVHDQPEEAKAMGLRGQRHAAAMLAPTKIGADMLALLHTPACCGGAAA